ncbi:hypothetical protein [Chitinophaga rhizosphaerae]|uniref:hypothetical protein n=1 Tax=Chitinophaga rhizosphaerae TaxID=1864947 RepID=UPI000F80088A|nr:hypothetical protein [Chitinophaga rhizosphaerae]
MGFKKKTSASTNDLIEGLQQMLRNRGSMTVEDAELLNAVIDHLKKHERLKGDERLQNGVKVVDLLLRFFSNPVIGEKVSELVKFISENL